MLSYSFLALCVVLFLTCSNASALPDVSCEEFQLRVCTMRIWGDPHIETCNDVSIQTTCAAPGLQLYLDLYFISITGVNTPLNPPVTVLTEVLIVFKSLKPPHPVTYIYKAASGLLPEDFQLQNPMLADNDVVTLTTWDDHVQLYWACTNINIIISTQRNGIYQVTMVGPQAIMNTGTGILIQGCPDDQVIESRELREQIIDGKEAKEACLERGVPENTADMDACEFDVIATGDKEIADATAMAIEDRVIAEKEYPDFLDERRA